MASLLRKCFQEREAKPLPRGLWKSCFRFVFILTTSEASVKETEGAGASARPWPWGSQACREPVLKAAASLETC